MFGVVHRHVNFILTSERLSHIRDSPPHSAAVCRESTKIQNITSRDLYLVDLSTCDL